MPLVRRMPKRGFSNYNFKKEFEIVNLNILDNKFNDGEVVNAQSLMERGIIKGNHKLRVKVLAKGELNKKLIIRVDAISKAANDVIVAKGGEVHLNKEM